MHSHYRFSSIGRRKKALDLQGMKQVLCQYFTCVAKALNSLAKTISYEMCQGRPSGNHMSSECRSNRTRGPCGFHKSLITKARSDVGDCRQPRQDTTRRQQIRLAQAIPSLRRVAKAKRKERWPADSKHLSNKFLREDLETNFFIAKCRSSEVLISTSQEVFRFYFAYCRTFETLH